jgi:putative ABC transport system permease protein
MVADFWQDLRDGTRMLVKNSGFSLIAIVMVAAGIGPNTVVLSVVNAVPLKPLPGAQPDGLVSLYTSDFSGPN